MALAADIGENGYLDINFLIQNDGRVRLEIDASDKELIDQFKSSVARVMRDGGPSPVQCLPKRLLLRQNCL